MPTLKLQIMSARNVPEGEYLCKITCGKNKLKTKTSKKSNNPEWNENFSLNIEPSTDMAVNIELEQTKKIGKKSFGTLVLDLSNVIKGKERIWYAGEGLSESAEIRISMQAVDFGKEEAKGSIPSQKTMLPPMPAPEEVERRYNEVMESLGLGKDFKHPTAYQTKAINEVSLENKWAMVCQHQKVDAAQKSGKIEDTPQYWTSKIKAEPNPKLIKELTIVLGGAPLVWIKNFIDAGGLANLLEILGNIEHDIHRRSMQNVLAKDDEQITMQNEVVLCLQRLMNNKTGLQGTINTEGGVKKVALCLDMAENMRLRIIELLTLVCLMPPDGHRLTIEGLTSYKALKKERRRFETLVKFLKEATALKSKIVYLTFINALINSPTDIDVRIAIRQEFVALGLPDIIKSLKEKLNPQTDIDLETQIDVYEEESNDDYKELHDRFADLDVNIDNVDDVFKHLKETMKKAGLATNFLGILQNFLIMPISTEAGVKSFLLACRIARQISLNKERLGTSDEHQINLADLLTSVQAESNEVPLNKKIEDLETSLATLNKKCLTLEIELKEKEEMISSLRAGGATPGAPGAPSGSGSDSTPGFDGPPPPPGFDGPPPPPGFDGPPPPPGFDGPPPPPGFDGPPPPPPMGGPPLPPAPGMKKIVKKKPRKSPNGKMKGLQWVKLPQNKIKGTIFENMDLDYKGIKIDYNLLEDQFSQKVIEKKEKEETKSDKLPPVQILDPKTSQNLSIFLSQFKNVSHAELCKGIQTLNQKMFTPEQVKQITTFIPSKDDITGIQLFLQGGGDPNRLPAAEKFALEMDKIPQLEQRVNAFYFKVTFDVRKSDIKPGVETLKQACKELLDSKKFPKLLELVLEIGNFLNDNTPRGGVFGFKLSSLPKMADTKTTDNTTTLLQFLVQILEKQAPDLLKFQAELPSVEGAARVSLGALQADMNMLTKDFNAITTALDTVFKEQKDRFVELMTSFVEKAKQDIETMQMNFKIMEDKYKDLCNYFGEESKTTQPEELFGTIMSFINAVQEAVKANEQALINAEKNARREDARIKRQAEMDAKKKVTAPEGHDTVVEELFGALKGGNIFKNRRMTQQQQQQQQQKPQSPAVPVARPGQKK